VKLLILGGTMFLGRYLVKAALASGHEVTLFNRGKTYPDLFPEVEKLRGDRKESVQPLAGRRWDAVIDTCGYVPRVVRMSAELLADAVDHYTFISTISVYSDSKTCGQDEGAPLMKLEDETTEEVTGETYGGLKALCEREAERAMPGRALIIRPGLITGPHDPSDRFTYWPVRVQKGGEILAPGPPGTPVQHIDVRDLAEWTLRAVEQKLTGVFNATGPDYAPPPRMLTMDEVLDTCLDVTGSDATFTWVTPGFLIGNEVGAFTEVPLWVPGEDWGATTVRVKKAIDAGLTFRPLATTIKDTLEWHAVRHGEGEGSGEEIALRAGLAVEREQDLLAKWSAQSGSKA
jgi:2'-hydroxyisoflavone reductase